MNSFSIKECLKFGWETFRKRSWFFIGFSGLLILLSVFSQLLTSPLRNSSAGVGEMVGFLISFFVSVFISYGQTRIFLRAHDSVEQANLKDFWAIKRFGAYALLYTGLSFAIMVGFILLIVPGVLLALVTMFSVFIFIDTELSPGEALKESSRITKGHLGQLFLFSLTLIGINILGALALMIGLLVSIPVSLLATVHAYRSLEKIS
jgi:uncharacterized membrane protein